MRTDRTLMANRKHNRKTLTGFAATRSSRGIMKRAAADLEQGLENTDCRIPDPTSQEHCPRPARKPAAPRRRARK
jgi:hypothetical protein